MVTNVLIMQTTIHSQRGFHQEFQQTAFNHLFIPSAA